jgi:hypothetical protein
VVDGEQGLLGEGGHLGPEVGLDLQQLGLVMPDASSGTTTSLSHQAVSVSAMRRRLSPQTRSHPSITTGRNPSESCASIADTTDSSSSRTWPSGRGAAKPTASVDHHQQLQGA